MRIGGNEISARWLRDHGDDPSSLDPVSGQRLVDTFSIPRDVSARHVEERDGRLTIDWSDGATTTHDLDALRAVIAAPRSPGPAADLALTLDPGVVPWPAPPADPTRFDATVIDHDDEWIDALTHLRRYGWLAIDGAAPGRAPVERLAARIGYPRSTVFGAVWEMAAGAQDHRDSAYDSIALDLHTDGTYSFDAPGTILFSQQRRGGDGGDSVLVDGFAAAADFAASDPTAADLLSRYEIRGRYVEPGVDLLADRVPLRLDRSGVLRQVSFNNYDRAPVLPAAGHLDDVLDAYQAFRATFTEASRALVLDWEPGRMLLFDNWRLLHGRTEYQGARVFLGCYTNHEDLEGAYRRAGLGERRGHR